MSEETKPTIEINGTTLCGENFPPGKAIQVVMKGAAASNDYVHPDDNGSFELELIKATVAGEYFLEVQAVGSSTAMPLTTGFKKD